MQLLSAVDFAAILVIMYELVEMIQEYVSYQFQIP